MDVAISIHTPLAGSDEALAAAFNIDKVFQSTLPLRGATTSSTVAGSSVSFQSTLPLRGATILSDRNDMYLIFQSTLPLRGATLPTGRHRI